MNQSLWVVFADASIVVKLVMLLLLSASVLSWTFIFQRWFYLKNLDQSINDFESEFWSGRELNQLYENHRLAKDNGMSEIFHAGFKEFMRLRNQVKLSNVHLIEAVQRSMRIAYSREVEKLEQHLSFLGSVGSVSPYIGLFGTVWGIMNSLHALGNVQQATIAMVAPGISETLIATAMGLFAAIPAVLAYNRFSNKVERLLNQYETFQEEFSSILQHQLGS